MSNGQRLHEDASPIPVVRYEPTSLHGEVLAPRGSVVVYVAARESTGLQSIRAAASGQAAGDELLQDVDRIDDDGYVVTLTYGDQVLAEEVRVPRDGQPVRLILPFTGGEIETQELLVRSAEGAGVVDAVAVRHDPPLSAVEAAALTLLPRDQLSVNLGVALPGGIAMDNDEERRRQEEQRRAAEDARQERAQQQAEAQAEAAEARAEARREAREAGGISRLEIHMLDSTIRSISSLQTAGAMLEIRRDLLKDQMEHG